MFMKRHRCPDGEVLAVCDRELLNTTIRHGDLEVAVSEGFYGTECATKEEVRDALRCACNVNLMGKRVIDLAIEMGLITRGGCIYIGDVPHAVIVLV